MKRACCSKRLKQTHLERVKLKTRILTPAKTIIEVIILRDIPRKPRFCGRDAVIE
jgi:hypothetical protein